MAQSTCPHCGSEVVGAKIKCNTCGRMLSEPPAPDDLAPGGQVILRGQEKRSSISVRPGMKHSADFSVDTSDKRVVDITEQVKSFARAVGESGLVQIFLPHATAGLAFMETGSGSEADLGEALERLFPSDERYAHSHGAKGHGRSHIVPVFISAFLSVPCEYGHLLLGQWQSIVIVDPNEDNNERKVLLSYIPGRG